MNSNDIKEILDFTSAACSNLGELAKLINDNPTRFNQTKLQPFIGSIMQALMIIKDSEQTIGQLASKPKLDNYYDIDDIVDLLDIY